MPTPLHTAIELFGTEVTPLPFTPFHLGISLLFFALMPFLDPFALVVGAVIPDLEGFAAVVVFPKRDLPLHGPLHSFVGAIFLGIAVGVGSFLGWSWLQRVDKRVKRFVSLKKSLTSALLGTTSHIVLDAPLYSDMDPFLPFPGNPLLGIVPPSIPYLICILGFIVGFLLLLLRFRSLRFERQIFSKVA